MNISKFLLISSTLMGFSMMTTSAYAKYNHLSRYLNPHQKIIEFIQKDIDLDGDIDILLITQSTLPLHNNNGYSLIILERNNSGKLTKVGENKHIFSCIPCIKTEKILYVENIQTNKPNQFSLYQENLGNNSTFTFKKLHNKKWYLSKLNTNNIQYYDKITNKIKVISQTKSYPKNFDLIYFDIFNPDLF